MDMIEVDPKLFVTCRLCLEDLGQYQIVPTVQQQIKYCYDIDVEPFDGLPQLICMKCKEVLSNFFTIKKLLCDKQLSFKNKVTRKQTTVNNQKDSHEQEIQPQQNTVSSSQQAPEILEETIRPKQKKKRVIHSSDSDSTGKYISHKKKSKIAAKTVSWDKTGLKKELVCTICGSKWLRLKSLLNHHRSHLKLKSMYPSIFKKKCSVSLKKIDDKANLTGMNNIIVHNERKIIENCTSLFYYIKYSKEIEEDKEEVFRESCLENTKSLYGNSLTRCGDTDSTDTEQEIDVKRKRRKRIISRSSNETVVIESKGNKVTSDNEDSKLKGEESNPPIAETFNNDQCINIDDSSESDTDKNEVETTNRLKPPLEAKLGDYKVIQGIITMCVNAYNRKSKSTEKAAINTESQLKRKILGIGRKIINREGFNWTGMLKFMEHKNLGIVWVTKGVHTSKESNFIRIMTKLRENDTTDDNQGWVPVAIPDLASIEKKDLSSASPVQISIENKPNQSNILPTAMDSAILYFNNSSDPKNKLLNANPVANPKQLPRKTGPASTEVRINKVVSEACAFVHNNEGTELCMPIITSTTSLAVPNNVEQPNDSLPVVNSNPETSVPRIKVKPVTELMSERMLNSLREQSSIITTSNMLENQIDNTNNVMHQIGNTNAKLTQNTDNIPMSTSVWPPSNLPNVFTSNMIPPITPASQPLQLVQVSCVNPRNVTPRLNYPNITPEIPPVVTNNMYSRDELVLLSTVELPNTKTNSPFKYLKNLSRIHNLVLIDPYEHLSRDFICLIKFKVQFKQEPIDEPIVLCLSLCCAKNKFCFTVRDRNQKDINMNNISPNWQWEIIKIFRGGLVDRLLQNARKHSQETHEYTNKFLCLLKSINFQKIS